MLLEMSVKMRRGHFDLTGELSVDADSVGLFGKSGAGKSTLLGLIVGNIQPQSGHIVLDGKILYDSRKGVLMPREQRPIGAVLQYNRGNGLELAGAYLMSVYKRTLQQRRLFKPEFLIALLELGSILEQPLASLSASERQKVALARALIKSPKLLVLDDTFAVLGCAYRSQLLPILKRLQTEFGLPILYASRWLGDILELTDQLVVLDHGRIVLRGALKDIAKQQGVFHYLGIRQIDNILPVKVNHHDVAAGCSLAECFGVPLCMPLRPNLPQGFHTQVSIRANDIALADRFVRGISIQNQIKGRICSIIPKADSVIVQVDCGCALLVEITPGACREMALQEGQTVYCLIKAHVVVYMNEMTSLPNERVVSHGDGFYYLTSQAAFASDSSQVFY